MKMDEFARIKKYFAPLSSTELGALGLRDDAAILPVNDSSHLIVSADALVQGVHFRSEDSPYYIARKALRTNLSDLAAMGSQPIAYTLALVIGKEQQNKTGDWLEKFSAGLACDQEEFKIALIGGDSVTSPGPTSISITIFGQPNPFGSILRGNAKVGDDIFVSGTIGDASLGLRVLKGKIHVDTKEHAEHLVDRYQLPRPRVALGAALGGVASAAMDVSDGLLQDLGHICGESTVGAVINWKDIPISEGANQVLNKNENAIGLMLNGGDDYEIVFTASPSSRQKVMAASDQSKTPVTRIGHIELGGNVSVIDGSGRPMELGSKGYRHA